MLLGGGEGSAAAVVVEVSPDVVNGGVVFLAQPLTVEAPGLLLGGGGEGSAARVLVNVGPSCGRSGGGAIQKLCQFACRPEY